MDLFPYLTPLLTALQSISPTGVLIGVAVIYLLSRWGLTLPGLPRPAAPTAPTPAVPAGASATPAFPVLTLLYQAFAKFRKQPQVTDLTQLPAAHIADLWAEVDALASRKHAIQTAELGGLQPPPPPEK